MSTLDPAIVKVIGVTGSEMALEKCSIPVEFENRERKTKPLLPKLEHLRLGTKQNEKVLFYNGNSTGKIWHTFACFWRRRKENEASLAKNRKKSLGHKKLEKVLFYNGNSTGKIWHTFSCFWRKRKENEAILTQNRKFSFGHKKPEKMLFTIPQA